MCAFNTAQKAPGVYIDEVDVFGAIAGVGTSTLALLGPAEKGPVNAPTRVTNYTQFEQAFGGGVRNHYATHALRGFFGNGGTTCYFVRVSDGEPDTADLLDAESTSAMAASTIRFGKDQGYTLGVEHWWSRNASGVWKTASTAIDVASYSGDVTGVEKDGDGKVTALLLDPAAIGIFLAADRIFAGDKREEDVVKEVKEAVLPDGTTALKVVLNTPLEEDPTGKQVRRALRKDERTLTLASAMGIQPGMLLQLGKDGERCRVQDVSGQAVTMVVGLAASSAVEVARGGALFDPLGVTRMPLALAAPKGTTTVVAGANQFEVVSPGGEPFVAGDEVSVGQEVVTVTGVDEPPGKVILRVTPALASVHTAETVAIAGIGEGATRLRLEDVAGVHPGTHLHLGQGTTEAVVVVQAVNRDTGEVYLRAGVDTPFAANQAVEVRILDFGLALRRGTGPVTHVRRITMDSAHPRYVGSATVAAEAAAGGIRLVVSAGNRSAPGRNLPVEQPAVALSGGTDEQLRLGTGDYAAGFDALRTVDAVNIVCAPDVQVLRDADIRLAIQKLLVTHCTNMQDRFAVLDSPPGASAGDIEEHRAKLGSDKGFGAVYYPWVRVADPESGAAISLPPSGHIAGVFARTDSNKGVHKAPANEAIAGVLDVEATLNATEQGILNDQNINVIRPIRGRGIRIWGGRTLSSGTQWRYVNVRRLLLFIEESIQEALERAVFDPNNVGLWKTLERSIGDFLLNVWKTGALFGAQPEDGFSVRIDEELNPPDQIAVGILTIEIKLRPTTPAEFIVIRIIQDSSRALVQE